MVPKGWKILPFSDIATIGNGQVDPKEEPYLSMKHIGPENVISHSGQLVDLHTSKELALISGKYFFDDNSIVYSKIRPNLNKVCTPNFVGICSADMYPIWTKPFVNKNFLFQYMLGPIFNKTAISFSMRTGMPKINRADLNSIEVAIPPIKEQKKIAVVLSTWDKVIETTEELISNSQAQKRALMQQLLTGKKRLLDENGERFSGKWEKVKIKTIFTLKTETDSSNSYPIYSVTKNGLMNQQDYFKKEVASSDTSKYKIVHPNEFVMSGLNFWMGSVDIHLKDYPVIVSPAYKTYYINKNYNILFLKNFIKSNQFLKVLIGSSVTGASIVRRNFNTETFENWPLSIPKLKEQEKIASVLSNATQEIKLLEKKLEYLKQEKKALMQQLLTGKRRVTINLI